jgi:hypothetical protein
VFRFRNVLPCKSVCNKTDLLNAGIQDLNSLSSLLSFFANGTNCQNFISTLIGQMNSQNLTDIQSVNNSLISQFLNSGMETLKIIFLKCNLK